MLQDKKRDKETDKARCRFGSHRAVLVALVVVPICGFIVWRAVSIDSGSIDERLAAIDAELAIPDSENAAIHYMKFFADPDNATILDDLFVHTPSAWVEPWVDSENPELAAELNTHHAFIQTLLDISQMPKARFPVVYVDPGTDPALRLADLRDVTFVLSWAAANDLAKERIDAAHSKYECQLRMARHLQQQPTSPYSILGISIEHAALQNITKATMRDGITLEQLRSLEMILGAPVKQDVKHARIAARVDRLMLEKRGPKPPPTCLVLRERHGRWVFVEKEMWQLPPGERIEQWWLDRDRQNQRERQQRLFGLRVETTRRAMPILIALRCYKEATGAWPETLARIEPRLAEGALIDPQNNGPFVYKRDGEGFIFYSKGPNGIDEHGFYKRPADDWPIWPLIIK